MSYNPNSKSARVGGALGTMSHNALIVWAATATTGTLSVLLWIVAAGALAVYAYRATNKHEPKPTDPRPTYGGVHISGDISADAARIRDAAKRSGGLR